MSTSRDDPVPAYVPPRSLGEADIQRMVETGVPEHEAREVVLYDYVAWDEQTSPFKVHVTRTSEAPPQTNKHVG